MTAPRPSLAYAWYTVGVLMLAFLLSYVDRSIMSLLVDPIRRDLALSDTQISLLHGFAFAVFYAAFGLPLGRLADRTHRVRLIVAGVTLWSLFTAACGLARNFWQLFVTRMGVGVGEAALNPSAYSIITDSFPRHLLARALSTYVMGTYMGFGLAFIMGGMVVRLVEAMPTLVLPLLGEVYTWQLAFFYAGLPGLFVAALIFLTLREPARRGRVRDTPSAAAAPAVPLREVVAFIGQNRRTLICHLGGFSLIGILVNGLVLWTPSFFHRTYGWEVADAGVAYGTILLLAGPMGIFAGGALSDWLDRKGPAGGSFLTAAVCVGCAIGPAIASPLVDNPGLAMSLIAVLVFFTSAPWGVAVSAIQQITPNEMRGQVSAIYLFVVNFIGIGFGPTVVALITDQVYGDDAALRYALSWVGGSAALAAMVLLLSGLGAFRASARRAEAWVLPATEGNSPG